jgi:hypothetical protein
MRRLALALGVAFVLAIGFSLGNTGFASGGDFSMDFTAAAPFSYNHDTGGGNYNDRTVGKFDDIVESLEGGDFACGDIVTFLTQIKVDAGALGSQTIRLHYEYTAHATGQQGVALVDNDTVGAGTSAAVNPNPPDIGTSLPNNSVATVVPGSEVYNGVTFVKPTTFFRAIDVTGLQAGETVVVRSDVAIACNGSTPTGNMQARLASAEVISPSADVIPAGAQTVPFKHVGDIKEPPCDPKTDPNCKP